MNAKTAMIAAAIVVAAASEGRAATRRIFSYDPADDATRRVAGALTFEFNQKMWSTTVLKVRATEGQATADLRRSGEDALGRGGLAPLIGAQSTERDLYEVLAADDGRAMMAAFCPQAARVWMAFGRLRANQDLKIFVVGRSGSGRAQLCQTLQFTYHGEWRLPPGMLMSPDRVPEPQFPY